MDNDKSNLNNLSDVNNINSWVLKTINFAADVSVIIQK